MKLLAQRTPKTNTILDRLLASGMFSGEEPSIVMGDENSAIYAE
jgi:hypothetical protein